MENKIIEEQKMKLIEKLSPTQSQYFDAIDWYYNGARATGRTHLACTVALFHILNGGDGFVFDHVPYNEGSRMYMKTMLFQLADYIGLRIKVHEVRNGFVVSRDTSAMPIWTER